MATQNRTNRKYHKNKESKEERFKELRRGFWHCKHFNSPAYNPFPSPVDYQGGRIQLRSNEVEMEYVKARIELEGKDSKKWPGADWVEEGETNPRFAEPIRQDGQDGCLRYHAKNKASA